MGHADLLALPLKHLAGLEDGEGVLVHFPIGWVAGKISPTGGRWCGSCGNMRGWAQCTGAGNGRDVGCGRRGREHGVPGRLSSGV